MTKITVGIPTKNRYDSLKLTLFSIINQTLKPSEVIIIDDSNEPIDLRVTPNYKYLLDLMTQLGIDWKVLYGQKKGQHYSHQTIQEIAKNDLIFRIDDDEVADYDVLESLAACMTEEVGAVAPAVIIPPGDDLPHWITTNYLPTIDKQPNVQWHLFSKILEVEHLYSCFLYRKGIVNYDLTLSPVAHREETIFTHSIYREGYKLLVNGSARVWHFREEKGGIRSTNNKQYYEDDEKIFQGYLSRWDLAKNPENKIIVLDNGLGDHYAFKNLLPEFRMRYKSITIACCYPEVFEDQLDIKVISVLDAIIMFGNIDGFSVYKFMKDHQWTKSIIDAYKELYL